jgi:hypothetical protein
VQHQLRPQTTLAVSLVPYEDATDANETQFDDSQYLIQKQEKRHAGSWIF